MRVGPRWPIVGTVMSLLIVTVACDVLRGSQRLEAAPAGPPAPPPVLAPGDHEIELEHGGRERRALLRVPPRPEAVSDDAVVRHPVLLAFHGGGGNARQFRRSLTLDEDADARGFIVVYPYGTGKLRRSLLTWNAGTCCGYATNEDVDDVDFVRALLDELGRRTPIDTERVYATGFSNGAMFAYRLAAELPDRIAAIAAVSGAMVLPKALPTRPVPILHIHSVDDPRALYAGGLGPPFPLTNSRQQHTPVRQVLQSWAAWNGCGAEPEEGEPVTAENGHTATRLTWGPGSDGVEVVHWRLTGGGHAWPGGVPTGREKIVGAPTDVIDADGEIWDFLSRWTLTREADAHEHGGR